MSDVETGTVIDMEQARMARSEGESTRRRFCTRCGGKDGNVRFRSEQAARCINCDEETEEERKAYHKRYHKARSAAIRRLIAQHNRQFQRMLIQERAALGDMDEVVDKGEDQSQAS